MISSSLDNCTSNNNSLDKNSLSNNSLSYNFLSSSTSTSSNSNKTHQTNQEINLETNLSKSNNKAILINYWNYTIEICKQDKLISKKFNSQTYDQFGNNCLDFILFFFKLLDLDEFKNVVTKTELCELLIKSKINELFKIIELDRCDSNRFLILDYLSN